MRSVKRYLAAFGRGYTYNPWRNPYLWFGFLWGLPVPFFSLFLDLTLSGVGGRTPLEAIRSHPLHVAFLAHPFLFAAVFGAMGSVRRELEEENARLIATLRDQAITDPLTGLYNRRFVLESAKGALLRALRNAESLSFILFDLDRFKEVNERDGHPAGDEKLREVARALRSVLRQSDVVGRFGGDEFLLVASGDAAAGAEIARRAEEAVALRSGMGLSWGLGVFPDDGGTPGALIVAADRALKEMKKARHGAPAAVR